MSALANFLVLADCRVGRLSVGGLSFGGLSFGELSYLLDCRVGGLSEYVNSYLKVLRRENLENVIIYEQRN
jgi:hypothetical protein